MANSTVQIARNISRWFTSREFGPMGDVSHKSAFFEHFTYDIYKYLDDFTGPTINSTQNTVGNGGGASAASPAVDTGKVNGQAKFVTGTAGDNTASSILVTGRHFYGQNNAVMQARLNINSAVTSVKVELGFKDNILTAAGNGNVVATMATPTFNTGSCSDGVCWCYDTNNSATGWQGLGQANQVPATTDAGYNIAPVADTFETLQIALVGTSAFFSRFNADGRRTYFGGAGVNKAMLGAVTATVLLAPYIYVEARSGSSKTVDVDYILAYQPRTTTP